MVQRADKHHLPSVPCVPRMCVPVARSPLKNRHWSMRTLRRRRAAAAAAAHHRTQSECHHRPCHAVQCSRSSTRNGTVINVINANAMCHNNGGEQTTHSSMCAHWHRQLFYVRGGKPLCERSVSDLAYATHRTRITLRSIQHTHALCSFVRNRLLSPYLYLSGSG